jgi:hypothetical protein
MTTEEPEAYYEFDIACHTEDCPQYGVVHTVRAKYGFGGAACHWCTNKLSSDEYQGHIIEDHHQAAIDALPEPPGHKDMRLRLEAQQRLLDREIKAMSEEGNSDVNA